MKKSVLFIFLLFCFFSCDKQLSKKSNKEYYIFGKGKGFTDSTAVYLKAQESKIIISLDTSYIINNTFQFKGMTDKPEVFGIYVDSIKGSVGLFMENDSVTIDIDKNNLSNSKIKGSKLNDKYLDFIKKSNDIISKTKHLFPLFQKARTENDLGEIIEINKKIKAIHEENRDFILNYSKENPGSYIAAFALQTLLKDNSISKDTIASIYNNFTHEVKKGDFAMEILLYLENPKSL